MTKADFFKMCLDKGKFQLQQNMSPEQSQALCDEFVRWCENTVAVNIRLIPSSDPKFLLIEEVTEEPDTSADDPFDFSDSDNDDAFGGADADSQGDPFAQGDDSGAGNPFQSGNGDGSEADSPFGDEGGTEDDDAPQGLTPFDILRNPGENAKVGTGFNINEAEYVVRSVYTTRSQKFVVNGFMKVLFTVITVVAFLLALLQILAISQHKAYNIPMLAMTGCWVIGAVLFKFLFTSSMWGSTVAVAENVNGCATNCAFIWNKASATAKATPYFMDNVTKVDGKSGDGVLMVGHLLRLDDRDNFIEISVNSTEGGKVMPNMVIGRPDKDEEKTALLNDLNALLVSGQ